MKTYDENKTLDTAETVIPRAHRSAEKHMDIFDMIVDYNYGTDDSKKKLDRRQIKTKKAILRAYFDIVIKTNDRSKKISISELSRTANIDRKTFYLHYEDVDAVHKEIDKAISNFIEKIIGEYMRTDIRFEPYFLLEAVDEFLTIDLEFFRRTAKCDVFRDSVDAIKRGFYESLCNMYTDEEHPMNEKKKLTLMFVSSGSVDLYVNWLKSDDDLSLDDLSLFISRLLLKGLNGIRQEVFDE